MRVEPQKSNPPRAERSRSRELASKRCFRGRGPKTNKTKRRIPSYRRAAPHASTAADVTVGEALLLRTVPEASPRNFAAAAARLRRARLRALSGGIWRDR